jgi:hypothetical protein
MKTVIDLRVPSMKGENFLEQLSEYQLVKDSALWCKLEKYKDIKWGKRFSMMTIKLLIIRSVYVKFDM